MKQCLPAICDEGFDNITKHILDDHMETVKNIDVFALYFGYVLLIE